MVKQPTSIKISSSVRPTQSHILVRGRVRRALKRLWRRLAPAAHLADAVSCSAPASPASASPSSTASPWRQTSPVKACAGDTPEVRVNGGSESL